MMKRLMFLNLRVYCVPVMLLLSLGCNVSNQIKGHLGQSSSSANDFAKSEIVVSSVGIADGSTPLNVLVRLVNSNGSVVSNYRPEYQILSGSGVITAPCTVSDANGVAVCALKANSPGVKSMRVTNLGTKYPESSFEFIPIAAKGTVAGFSSSGSKQVTSSGYLVHSSMSGWMSTGIYQVTAGNYKVYTNLQGAMDSE